MSLSLNSRGAALMALAMAAFTCNDAIVKLLTFDLSIGQIMFMRGLLTTILVYAIARYAGALAPLRDMLHPMVLVRSAFEIASTVLFLMALNQMPLPNISAILQSLPLAVTLGAAVFLREPVGWRRWSAIVVGFIGVLIIVRPGPEGFTGAAFLAILSVFTTAGRDLVTRKIPSHIPSLSITVFTASTNSLVGLALIPVLGGWQPMDTMMTLQLATTAVFVFVGYQSIILSMRIGEISFVAPFRYVSLLWALAIGYLVFSDVPEPPVLLGAAIVIASGLYTFYRERKRRRQKVPVPQ
ncbi:DMT family transporter [Rhizobiaceae bacterium BDR2-2]|uniref:DMT family transporter n=1 Tax=Ectorhizobium quercum TaxID=2965071 RepID=A0AAE3N4K8_9HYPH|nr:DMT family transporter [Ectorhizobium quercum]MCX8999826.1 DMT family transporter [Ectorhizobium quercum]